VQDVCAIALEQLPEISHPRTLHAPRKIERPRAICAGPRGSRTVSSFLRGAIVEIATPDCQTSHHGMRYTTNLANLANLHESARSDIFVRMRGLVGALLLGLALAASARAAEPRPQPELLTPDPTAGWRATAQLPSQ